MRGLLALPLLALLCACASDTPARRRTLPPGNPVVEQRRVEETLDAFVRAENEGSLPTLLACFTEKAILFPPGEERVRGVLKVGERFQRLFDRGHLSVRMRRDELTQTGALAVVHGRLSGALHPASGGPAQPFEDDFLMVLERRSPGWRISHLMWNPAPRERSTGP